MTTEHLEQVVTEYSFWSQEDEENFAVMLEAQDELSKIPEIPEGEEEIMEIPEGEEEIMEED